MRSRYDTRFRSGVDGTVELDDLSNRAIGVGSSQQSGRRTVRVSSDGLGVASLSIEQTRVIRDALDDIIHTAETDEG